MERDIAIVAWAALAEIRESVQSGDLGNEPSQAAINAIRELDSKLDVPPEHLAAYLAGNAILLFEHAARAVGLDSQQAFDAVSNQLMQPDVADGPPQ